MHPEPIATYRLQLRPGFGLKEAAALIPYLKELGISHIYTSSFLQAAKDSTHGYDVVDPTKINDQLGNETIHAELCEDLKAAGMGHMIDVVPNHMAIIGKQNPWWWDVLENGSSSQYAIYFDVDWDSSEERWPNKVLLPVLSDHYGRILEKGEIRLSFEEGQFTLHYQDQVFPVDPSSLAELLRSAAEKCPVEMLAFLAECFSRLPRPTVSSRKGVERRHRDKAVLASLLTKLYQEDSLVKDSICTTIENYNKNPDLLDRLIDQQNYRLAFWKTASKDLGYRRFFDIKELIGLRMEDLEVFESTHLLPIRWYHQGLVQGLRIDHPDGLRDPTGYFVRLSTACPGAWIIAEKILEPGEKLPVEWNSVSGTTGYEFLNLINGIFVDPKGTDRLTALYSSSIGEEVHFSHLVYQCKRLVLNDLFGSEVNRLTTLFVAICERHRRYRDYTRTELSEALIHVASGFPVYRSYVTANRADIKRDEEWIDEAIQNALKQQPDLDKDLLTFLKSILLLRVEGALESELAMRFQQLTGPAMAKGFEDTALYKYNRLISLNEVGGNPSEFGITQEGFHKACEENRQKHPLTLIATTTHDTKRSEDCRLRINLLSEIPEQWEAAVKRWTVINQQLKEDEIDPNTEYLLYQTLIGAWPISKERLWGFIEKAIREAKVHTSWSKPNQEYESAVREFVSDLLENKKFTDDFKTFAKPLFDAGYRHGLSQTLIKLTIPGIPDIYQGSELWNLTLVDPDNRQAVDYGLRRDLMAQIKKLSLQEILSRMEEGLPKLWLIHQVLSFRKNNVDLFNKGSSYTPLYVSGKEARSVIGYVRGDRVIVAAPIRQLNVDWQDSKISLPSGIWQDLFSKKEVRSKCSLEELFQDFPVALLVKL